MDITSENILEDINNYRTKNGLAEIEKRSYYDNSVIFNIKFSKVIGFKADIEAFDGMFIMDTEITSYDQCRGYEVSFHLNAGEYISFYCKGAQVTIDRDLIFNYTNGLSRIPFCKVCRSRLITGKHSDNFLTEHPKK